MGKRTRNLGGLSHFAKHAFQDNAAADPSHNPSPISSEQLQQVTKQKNRDAGKSREVGLLGAESSAFDATGLVPHYKNASEVPEHLQKYFSQRKRYFTLYDEGCLLDEEGWYSVTPELIADQIAERCRCDTILDAFCGVGGNAIAFAKTCERVIALDISPVRLALARHNAVIYGVADRIEFILADYISFANAYLSRPAEKRPIDAVFLSPPWGGPAYISQNSHHDAQRVSDQSDVPLEHPEFSLSSIKPIHGVDLFHVTRKITKNVAYFLPRNTGLDEISALLPDSSSSLSNQDSTEMVEVEEQWMGTKLKALTCYFGGLADGQQHLF
ncbi:RNA cap guanine-N2 methyltransferase-domain-containing protein [Melanogaster broomeanus]|nr:RNA cap guanine-N2 methyltransferase-domain-containing protein [Melanogaster broomeanus]